MLRTSGKYLLLVLLLLTGLASVTARAGAHLHRKIKRTVRHHVKQAHNKSAARNHRLGKAKKGRRHHRMVALRDIIPSLDSLEMSNWSFEQSALVQEIKQWTMVRYRKGGSSHKGTDCSGFTSKVYHNALAIDLPRTAHEQRLVGTLVDGDSLVMGDLLFFKTPKRKMISHVAIYLENGKFVHSCGSGGVRVDSLAEAYYAKRLVGAQRELGAEVPCYTNFASGNDSQDDNDDVGETLDREP